MQADLPFWVSDQASICDDLQVNDYRANSNYLVGSLVSVDSSNHVIPPALGTYVVGSPSPVQGPANIANVSFVAFDGACGGPLRVQATSGNLVVNDLRAEMNGYLNGSFDLTFGSDHVSGSLALPYCAYTGSATLSCK